MDINGFIDAFRGAAGAGKWRLRDEGELVTMTSGRCECPVTYLANRRARDGADGGRIYFIWQADEAGAAMGMEPKAVRDIIDAADYMGGHNADLRADLFRAAGIADPIKGGVAA